MRLHRFFIKDKINPKEKLVLRYFDNESILNQWKKVFRYLAGSRVVLFDGSGNDYLAIIEKLDTGEAVLRILETNKTVVEDEAAKSKTGVSAGKLGGNSKIDGNTVTFTKRGVGVGVGAIAKVIVKKPKVKVTILMSLIKNDNFDLVLQKATELGVTQIVPVITERTIKKDLNMQRSQRILVEASEQCGRVDVPVITPVKRLKEALSELSESKTKEVGVFVCNMGGTNIKDILSKKNTYKDLVFLIGPEGGWSPKEIALFDGAKIKSVSINQNVLRAETAVLALLAVVLG
jgi:RsmE family RNA methyltransferase